MSLLRAQKQKQVLTIMLGSLMLPTWRKLSLEVSGTDQGDLAVIHSRLKEKLDQLRKGNSTSPGIATVIGFKEKYAGLERLND